MKQLSLLIIFLLLTGCAPYTLDKIHMTDPRQTGEFQVSYQALAACAKEHLQTDPWYPGQPILQSIENQTPRMIRIYSVDIGNTVFEATFQPTALDGTSVEYRGMPAFGVHDKAWAIIERCSQQARPATAPSAASASAR